MTHRPENSFSRGSQGGSWEFAHLRDAENGAWELGYLKWCSCITPVKIAKTLPCFQMCQTGFKMRFSIPGGVDGSVRFPSGGRSNCMHPWRPIEDGNMGDPWRPQVVEWQLHCIAANSLKFWVNKRRWHWQFVPSSGLKRMCKGPQSRICRLNCETPTVLVGGLSRYCHHSPSAAAPSSHGSCRFTRVACEICL